MGSISSQIDPLERHRAQAIAALLPFFLDNPATDLLTRCAMATDLLNDYYAKTPLEVQLSAQVIALGWASMACLRTAAAVRDLTIDAMLDIQDDAIALNKMAEKYRKMLDFLQNTNESKRPAAPVPTTWDQGAFQLVMNKAAKKMDRANALYTAYQAKMAPPAPKLPIPSVVAPERPVRTKIQLILAEPMTAAVLAWRARH